MNFISTEQVLTAYIRTETRPLQGGKAYVVSQDGRDCRDSPLLSPACACPIGVLCLDAGKKPYGIESGTLQEFLENRETGEGNMCWVDGFVSGWEETVDGEGYSPESFDYSPGINPEGLAVYDLGYANGQRIRKDFIRLGLRNN